MVDEFALRGFEIYERDIDSMIESCACVVYRAILPRTLQRRAPLRLISDAPGLHPSARGVGGALSASRPSGEGDRLVQCLRGDTAYIDHRSRSTCRKSASPVEPRARAALCQQPRLPGKALLRYSVMKLTPRPWTTGGASRTRSASRCRSPQGTQRERREAFQIRRASKRRCVCGWIRRRLAIPATA